MSYTVKNAPLSSRIGTGFGQGLAEQLPKEIERGRLASGLERFSQQSPNQTMLQNYAQLASIPGAVDRPQLLQTFGELAKQQNMRNSFINNRKGPQRTAPTQQQFENDLANQKLAIDPNTYQRQLNEQEINPQKQGPEFQRGAPLENNQVNPQNPTNDEFKTRKPWTQDQRENFVGDYIARHPEATAEQAYQQADRAEQAELAQPKAVQEEYERLENKRKDLNTSFDNKLATKLQKNPIVNGVVPGEIYKDVSGENIEAMRRAMDEELAKNPKGNIEDITDKWSTRALDFAKAKDQLRSLPKSSAFDFMNPKKQATTLKKLEQYSKIYADTGNSEELFNTLKSNAFEMSPQGAASIAYPLNKDLKKYVQESKPKGAFTKIKNVFSGAENSRKHAVEIADKITDEDSLLSIAQFLSEQDTQFDENAFFDQLGKMKYKLGLNKRQERELAEGASGRLFPTWGDLSILTPFRGQR